MLCAYLGFRFVVKGNTSSYDDEPGLMIAAALLWPIVVPIALPVWGIVTALKWVTGKGTLAYQNQGRKKSPNP